MRLPRLTILASILIFTLAAKGDTPTYNDTDCKARVQNLDFWFNGTTDENGIPLTVQNASLIDGYLYQYCIDNCGSGSSYNDFNSFQNQFTLWFLPWFTLLAQIPLLTFSPGRDFLVIVLTVGSPTTALYSLFVTIFNRKDFSKECKATANQEAASEKTKDMLKAMSDVLGSLHQFPTEIHDVGLLACSYTADNEEWWGALQKWFIGRRSQMEASWYAQLLLALIVYLFAILQSFLNLGGGHPQAQTDK
jgi:hypothetical protein